MFCCVDLKCQYFCFFTKKMSLYWCCLNISGNLTDINLKYKIYMTGHKPCPFAIFFYFSRTKYCFLNNSRTSTGIDLNLGLIYSQELVLRQIPIVRCHNSCFHCSNLPTNHFTREAFNIMMKRIAFVTSVTSSSLHFSS